jgi:hypothetical protein
LMESVSHHNGALTSEKYCEFRMSINHKIKNVKRSFSHTATVGFMKV